MPVGKTVELLLLGPRAAYSRMDVVFDSMLVEAYGAPNVWRFRALQSVSSTMATRALTKEIVVFGSL